MTDAGCGSGARQGSEGVGGGGHHGGSMTMEGGERKRSVVKIVAMIDGDGKMKSVHDGGERRESVNYGGARKISMDQGSRKSSTARRKSSFIKPLELDDVLTTELGQFGWYQARCLMLAAVPIMMSAFMSEYIFSAAAIPHRCQIPECGENSKSVPFSPDWLPNAVPTDSSCERYEPMGGNGTLLVCPAALFDQKTTVGCEGYVYQRENSVVYDFDLGCAEWLRALAGTLNSVGTLLVLIVIGFVSDRWGRRVALIISVFNLAAMGVIRAFSVNYPMYLTMQLLQTTFGAGTLSSSYVFGTTMFIMGLLGITCGLSFTVAELVGPKYRVATSVAATTMFAVGQVIMGGIAWLVQPWRLMILVLHVPCFLVMSYYWLLNESVRWLLSKQRFEEAKEVLLKVARANGTTISDKSLAALTDPPPPPSSDDESSAQSSLLSTIWHSPVLLRRVCTTPIWWITTTFVYYGLNINSTALAGNMYANYMAACAIEVPGAVLAVLALNGIGRRGTLAGGYLLSAACNFAFAFLAEDLATARLTLFLIGKLGISVVFASLYLFTSELYPTQYRHTLLAFSSMIGRIGSITAPLTPALMTYWSGLPSVMFGAMALLSGVLVLTQPETLGQRMPDTLQEAEVIGKVPLLAANTNIKASR